MLLAPRTLAPSRLSSFELLLALWSSKSLVSQTECRTLSTNPRRTYGIAGRLLVLITWVYKKEATISR